MKTRPHIYRQRIDRVLNYIAEHPEVEAGQAAGVEELHLLQGELRIDARKLLPGDYNRAEPGTADKRVWSETGCMCVLMTSTKDALS